MPNGHASEDKPESNVIISPPAKELTLRAAKKPEKRTERGSGTMTLVKPIFVLCMQKLT
jgi:hypothetical protein